MSKLSFLLSKGNHCWSYSTLLKVWQYARHVTRGEIRIRCPNGQSLLHKSNQYSKALNLCHPHFDNIFSWERGSLSLHSPTTGYASVRHENDSLGCFLKVGKNGQKFLKTSRKSIKWGTKLSWNQEISWKFSCLICCRLNYKEPSKFGRSRLVICERYHISFIQQQQVHHGVMDRVISSCVLAQLEWPTSSSNTVATI